MIRVRQVEVDVNVTSNKKIKESLARKLKIDVDYIIDYKINKESIDARYKPKINYIYEIDVKVENESVVLNKHKNNNDILITPSEKYLFKPTGTEVLRKKPVIIGSGPAGLFCAYMLAKEGYKPLVIERGEDVDNRVKTVNSFWKTGVLNKDSNVQFGEGGAGTFSDGKLNTLVKDPEKRLKLIFETFVRYGANPNILYVNKPHIGTDVLIDVVKGMRNEIISLGGTFRYNTVLTDIIVNNGKVESIILNGQEKLETDVLVLAIGHSARDTFKMLIDRHVILKPKPFAVGIRIEHPQEMIDLSQYGVKKHNILGPSSYKLTYHASNNRGVYTFCMCPGGFVVNASSEDKRLAINGMSYSRRDSNVANSAVLVTVTPEDYGYDPLDGINFQRILEEKAYECGQGKIPVQLYKDYKQKKISLSFGDTKPTFKGNTSFSDLNLILPNYVNEALKEGIEAFGRKIKGFSADDSILAAVESRTSSPVRIVRDELGESNIKGLYPCGEGAGYAGGITSAAIDGVKTYELITKKYHN